MDYIYTTERLKLKLANSNLAEEANNYFIRNKSFLNNTEPVHEDNFFSLEYHKNELEKDEQAIKNLSNIKFFIFKKEENKIIGVIALNNIIMGIFKSCYLSYKLDKDEINKGYMTEAVKKVIDIAFNELGLHRIEANIMPRNKSSLKVTEKLNFKNEGISEKYLKINGIWEDHIHMVILNEDI